MSKLSRALIVALIRSTAAASAYEWKGIFYTPEASYTWGAQKVGGKYVDPHMDLAAIPTTFATKEALTLTSGQGSNALSLGCTVVNSGGTIKPAADKCYKLVFDQSKKESTFTIDASDTNATAFFTQHLPTEFEDTDHYLKDTTGTDIEPVAQEPEPGAGGHGHGHGHGHGSPASLCVCQGKKNSWTLDCANQAAINEAVSKLEADTSCKANNPPATCIVNYHVMQAHHDHCLHDQLPADIEKKLHDYEQFYDDCFVKRQFNPALKECPAVVCTDSTAMTQAIQTLQAGCNSATACADTACSSAVKTVLAAHDTCKESQLPNNLEKALHDHEEPCAAQLCNIEKAEFDPYADSCGSGDSKDSKDSNEVSAASGFGGQEAFLMTMIYGMAWAF